MVLPWHAWFLCQLKKYCSSDIAGQSMCVGGATALAQAGASAELIWGVGWWVSDAFERYIWKNVIVLHALILGHMLHYSQTWFIFLLTFLALLWTVSVQVSQFPLSFILISTFSSKTPQKKTSLFVYPFYHLSRYCTNNAKVCQAALTGRLFTS